MTPTQRSLALLRSRGCIVDVTQRWLPHAKVFKDLLGFVDIVGVSPVGMLLLVQTTTASNMAARRKKIQANEAYKRLTLRSGFDVQILLHGWAKRGPRGGKKEWGPNEEEL